MRDMIQKTQNKSLRVISFKERSEPSDPLYTNHKILKLQKHLYIEQLSIYLSAM